MTAVPAVPAAPSQTKRGPSLKARVLADLSAADCSPLHRFGQNFMVDERVLSDLCAALPLAPGARVVEIGPGTGILTTRLMDAGAQVLAIEIDRGLAAWLETSLVPRGLTLVHGDALASKSKLHPAIEAFASGGAWMLASNLPYDVAIPVLLEAAALASQPRAIAATVQYECGQRLCSRPGDDAWGASAAVFQAAGEPRLLRRIGRDAFHPRPNVDSAIVTWTPRSALPTGFSTWVRAVFAYRRKVLPGALRDAGITREQAEAACAAASIDPARRLESLSAPELLSLHARI